MSKKQLANSIFGHHRQLSDPWYCGEQLLQEPAVLTSFWIVCHNKSSFLKLIFSGCFITAAGKKWRKLVAGPLMSSTWPCDSYLSVWSWFVGGMWKSLEPWARRALEWCKQSLMGHSDRSVEDKGYTDNGGLSHEMSEVKNYERWGADEVLSECV